MTTEEYLEKRKLNSWKFKMIIDGDSFLCVNRIHPIKQKAVKDIVDAARLDSHVKKIIIYGSSIRYDCDVTSDLDICIDWFEDCYDQDGILKPFTKNMRSTISAVTKGMADVVNYDYLDGTEVKAAVEGGIIVYEHNV